jgi:hypothetical protein
LKACWLRSLDALAATCYRGGMRVIESTLLALVASLVGCGTNSDGKHAVAGSGLGGSSGATAGSGSGAAGSSGAGASGAGGSGTGGSGGLSTGGSPSAGSGGEIGEGGSAGSAAGSAGTAGGSGSAGEAECQGDGDCTVYGDCCGCWGLGADEEADACPLNCVDSQCNAFAAPPTARCVFGRCTLDVSCDALMVTCRQAPPDCGPGMTPSVEAPCWGPCVESTECRDVTDCETCTGPEQACVYELGVVGRAHCVEVPSECRGAVDCACMGSYCGDFQPCMSTDQGISCGGG